MKPELMRGICQAGADAARRTDASPSLEVVPGIQAFLPTSAADCSCDEALLPAVSPAGPFCAPAHLATSKPAKHDPLPNRKVQGMQDAD